MVLQPRWRRSYHRFALGPRSLATTRGISVDFSSSGYLDVSVPPVTSTQPMCAAGSDGQCLPARLPTRRSTGQRICPPHRGLSQLITSFIGFLCQGIHRVPLPSSFRWFEHTDPMTSHRSFRCDLHKRKSSVTLCSFQGTPKANPRNRILDAFAL